MADIIDMPKLSDTMTVGTLVKWLKKEGDAVKAGDMLAEVETDKATMELETFFTGTLIKIYAQPGSQVAIGAPLCAIGKPGEAAPAAPAGAAPKTEDGGQKTAPAPAAAPAPAPVAAAPAPAPVPSSVISPQSSAPAPSSVISPQSSEHGDARLKISPLARKIAADQKVDASRLTGTGPHGRIVKADVLAAAANPALLKSPAPAAPSGLRSQVSGFPGSGSPIQQD
ncbi:MAG: biotin/lipoyl-containing protein, partial [Opitutus sp.]